MRRNEGRGVMFLPLQAARMTWRDWRSGELFFLMATVIVAITALSSVGFLVDRVHGALERDAHQLLGADVVVVGDDPLAGKWENEAGRLGLRSARTVTFPSMAVAETGGEPASQLVSLKAVTRNYPLRGRLRLKTEAGEREVSEIPAPGSAWVDESVLTSLGVVRGRRIRLGHAVFVIGGIIAAEPDRGAAFMNFAPRVMIAEQDLPRTHLIQEGSRVGYRLLVAGDEGPVAVYRRWAETEISRSAARGVRLESFESGRPDMRATLDRAQRFLSLASLLSAIMAAIALAVATRRFVARHLDSCAMLRCLGLSQKQATLLYLFEFVALAVAGTLLGIMLGYAAHFALLRWLGSLVTHELPMPSFLPVQQGLAFGLLLLAGFALPSLMRLHGIPHNRVIRPDLDVPGPGVIVTYGLGLGALGMMLLWQAGDIKLGLLTGAGFLACVGAFSTGAFLCLGSLSLFSRILSMPAAWRFAFNSLRRRREAAVLQISVLALGLTTLLLLTVIRNDLETAWKTSLPPDTPNHFLVNILPEQKSETEARLSRIGVAKPVLYPMTRGRLTAINGRVISRTTFADEQARRLADREFNLSEADRLPPGNRIVAGRWFEGERAQASVESGLAKSLGLALGDRLSFDVGGQQVTAVIASLRKLEWSSMRVNFFVILDPKAMAGLPVTWVTSFYLPPTSSAALNTLVRDYPNLTLIDVGAVLRQVREVVDQVTAAVEFLFLFALLASLLVLYAALEGSQEERLREAGMLRILGATAKELSRAQFAEFLVVGTAAGLLSAAGASFVGWLLVARVFELEWSFSLSVWGIGVAAGMACAFGGGILGLRSVLKHPPLHTLRAL